MLFYIICKHSELPSMQPQESWCETLINFAGQITNAKKINQYVSTKVLQDFEKKIEQQFLDGSIDLQQRGQAEKFLQDVIITQQQTSAALVNKYYCNFSIFQSMPDIWGLQQIFPIVPLARLKEEPTEQARLHDLTCDSDGQISTYTCQGSLSDTLSLHSIIPNEDYVVGCFLVGAYQEILGDVHNLFGDTHTANVERGENGELVITELEIGDCVDELLAGIHLNGAQVMQNCKQRLEDYELPRADKQSILAEIEDALFSYTYLDSIDRVTHRIKGNKHA